MYPCEKKWRSEHRKQFLNYQKEYQKKYRKEHQKEANARLQLRALSEKRGEPSAASRSWTALIPLTKLAKGLEELHRCFVLKTITLEVAPIETLQV